MSSSKIFIDPLVGNVGIGVANPTAKLHVLGNARIQGDLIVNGSQTTVNNYTTVSSNVSIMNTSGVGPALRVAQTGSGAGYPVADFYDNDVSTTVPAVRIADGGNVGIGTANPQEKLHVVGSIKVSDRIVNASGRDMLNQTGGTLQVVTSNGVSTMSESGYFFSVAITPKSTSSKILVFASVTADKGGGDIYTYTNVNLYRIATYLCVVGNALTYLLPVSTRGHGSSSFMDSPATTSVVTYWLVANHVGTIGSMNFYYNCSLTAMEIAG